MYTEPHSVFGESIRDRREKVRRKGEEMEIGTRRKRDWCWSVPLFSKEMVSVVQCCLPLRGKDLLSSKSRLEHTDTHIDSGREREREGEKKGRKENRKRKKENR